MPEKIGRYEIEKEIGSGSTAAVYLGRDGSETVALKVLHRHLSGDPVIRERFRRELEIARTLRHPGITDVYDLIAHDGRDVAVMEYCEGKSLADRKIDDPDEWLRIAKEISKALAYAHSRGVIHRDLKPRNILFGSARAESGPEPVKLSDFGSAHVQNLIGITTSTMFIGTPQYVPPESLTGRAADPRWDLYSLGAVLYQTATGVPHNGSTMAALFRQGAAVRPPQELNPAVPAWFGKIILDLLGPIERRPRSASALLVLLEEERSPGTVATKDCLFCGAANPEDSPVCLSCGKREIEIVRYDGPDAETIVLKSLPEHVDAMDHFLRVIRAIAGNPELKLNVITEDARLYSRMERKQAAKLPAVLLEHLAPSVVDELIPVLARDIHTQIRLTRCPAAKASRKFKNPALVVPKFAKPGSREGAEFLSEKIPVRKASGTNEETKTDRIEPRDPYSPYLLAAYRLINSSDDRSLAGELGTLTDRVKNILDRMERLETALSSVSLGEIYGDIQRLQTKLEAADDAETAEGFAKLLEEKRHTYELYQEQERLHAELAGNVLDVLHRLEELVRLGSAPGSDTRKKAEIEGILRELS